MAVAAGAVVAEAASPAMEAVAVEDRVAEVILATGVVVAAAHLQLVGGHRLMLQLLHRAAVAVVMAPQAADSRTAGAHSAGRTVGD